MPQTVCGLDIGPDTIKAVLFTPRGLTGGRILTTRNLDINACGGIEEALKKLAEDKSFSNVPCGVSLPPADIILRRIRLPFRDEGKIRKTLPFELEPLIPLSIEEVATDYLMIPDNGLLVGALAKKNIREWIAKVEGNFGEVSVIDSSSTALAVQVIHGTKSSGCGIILDIGCGSTAAAFYEDETIIHVRSLAFGGRHLTEALAEEFSLDTDRAEQLKIGHDCPETSAKADEACRRFCAELKNTVEYMKLNGILQKHPSQITVTGGGSLYGPLRRELENYFSCPVEILDLIRLKDLEIEESIRSQIQPQIMNTAVAAALRLSAGRRSFNFRQGEFETKATRFDLKKQLRQAALVAGVILLLAVVNQIMDYGLKTRQLNGIKKQITQIFKKNFPEAQAMVDPVQQLKTKITEEKKTLGFGEGLPEATTADLLKEISSRVSSSLDIVITGLSYEGRFISLGGEAKAIDDVTAVRNELLKSGYFKDVTMGATSLTKDGGKVNFNLRIEVK
ncbi:MAG: pilus assembly protein PilM [Smithella sp.]